MFFHLAYWLRKLWSQLGCSVSSLVIVWYKQFASNPFYIWTDVSATMSCRGEVWKGQCHWWHFCSLFHHHPLPFRQMAVVLHVRKCNLKLFHQAHWATCSKTCNVSTPLNSSTSLFQISWMYLINKVSAEMCNVQVFYRIIVIYKW